MYLVPVVYDGFSQRKVLPGDILGRFDPIPPATDTTATLSYVAATLLANPVYVRNPAGASTDTYPTADQLVTAMLAGLGVLGGIPRGLTFNWRIINLSANLLTGAITANTGVTMTRGNVLASTTKDFQFCITNGTPLRTVNNVVSANASPILSGFSKDDMINLSVGMVVTNAVVNLQGQTIIGMDVTAKTVTMSGNANGAGPSNITFSPTYTITGLAA